MTTSSIYSESEIKMRRPWGTGYRRRIITSVDLMRAATRYHTTNHNGILTIRIPF